MLRKKLIPHLLFALLVVGCGNSTKPKDSSPLIDCNPDLVCAQVVTCCDGVLYPTACCDANCDAEMGICN